MGKDKHSKPAHAHHEADAEETKEPAHAATATIEPAVAEAPAPEKDAVVTPMSTPALPTDFTAKLTVAVGKIMNATARADIFGQINSLRGTLQASFNDATGDLTRAPQVREQVAIDTGCIRLAEICADCFRNIN